MKRIESLLLILAIFGLVAFSAIQRANQRVLAMAPTGVLAHALPRSSVLRIGDANNYLRSGPMTGSGGEFLETPAYPTGQYPVAVAAGDFNRDGNQDLAVVNNCGGQPDCFKNGSVSIFLGKGDGTFLRHTDYLTGLRPDAIAVGDFNRDGNIDLAIVNEDETVSVLLGNGDGTFQPQMRYRVGISPGSIAVGDFNGDGILDLAVTNMRGNDPTRYSEGRDPFAPREGNSKADVPKEKHSPTTVSILLGNGDGTFKPRMNFFVGSHAAAIAVGDFNGDGKLDLAVANYCGYEDNCGYPTSGTVSILLGNGDGTFQAYVEYATASGPDSIVLADFNGDGKTDIAVTSYCGILPECSGGGEVSILLGKGDGTFHRHVDYPAGTLPYAVTAGDFNGDGKTDLAIAASGDDAVSVLPGNGDGTFGPYMEYDTGVQPDAIVMADFNNDGKMDMATTNLRDNTVSILVGNGPGSFHAPRSFVTGNDPQSVAIGDFNSDHRVDLAVVNETNNLAPGTVSILLGSGGGKFQQQVQYATGLTPTAVAVGDFNGDGKADLAVSSYCGNDSHCFGSGVVSILLGNGDGTFQPRVDFPVSSSAVAIATGDFNGDGKLDLAVVTSNSVNVLLGNGDGTLQPYVVYVVGSGPDSVVLGDFNRDGKLDIAVANSCGISVCAQGTVSILLGKGNGTFKPSVQYPAGYLPQSVTVGDFNGDGKLDLALADVAASACLEPPCATFQGAVSVLLGNGDGTFQGNVEYNAGDDSSSVVTADFNGDGKADLAVANRFSNTISILLGNGNGTFQTRVDYRTDVLPSFLLAADVNGDGRPDLVIPNGSSADAMYGDTVSVLVNTGGDRETAQVRLSAPHHSGQ